MDVSIQSGLYDCGLFAIVCATALALGEKPQLFFFDQWNMRAHLRQCFEDGKMKMFPVLRKRRVKKSAVKTTEEVQVYCKCRMPELPGEQLKAQIAAVMATEKSELILEFMDGYIHEFKDKL